jgi:hypothetical protein
MHGLPEFLDGKSVESRDSVRVVVESGTTYRYSGGGFIVLQVLTTDVTG